MSLVKFLSFVFFVLSASSTWRILFSLVPIFSGENWRRKRSFFYAKRCQRGENGRRRRAIMGKECNWNFLPGNVSGWKFLSFLAFERLFMLKIFPWRVHEIFHTLGKFLALICCRGYNYQFFTRVVSRLRENVNNFHSGWTRKFSTSLSSHRCSTFTFPLFKGVFLHL